MLNLGIEEILAMLIQNDKFVSYKQINKYATKVISILKNRGIKANFILSRDMIDNFLGKYNIFLEINSKENSGIFMNGNADLSMFMGYLPTPVILAMDEALEEVA